MRKILRQISPQTILVAVFVLSISLFSVVTLFPSLFYHKLDLALYLVFHNCAELFGIVVCLSIFGVGWYTYDQSKNGHALFVSTMFLGIALVGLMHTLSFPGMPPFVTPNSTDKAIQFWLAFRLYYAGAFLASAYVYPDTKNRWLRRTNLLLFSVAVSALVFSGVIYFPSHMPITFIDGTGLTPFKIFAEYAIIGLLALSFAAYWNRFSGTKDKPLMFYLSALVLSIFSELSFTLYKSAFDTYNMLGHVFEVGAFCLIYKGIFAASVVYPYERIQDTSKKLEMEIAERKRVEEALNRLNRELRAISSCNQIVMRASDEQTLLNEICRIICDEAGYHLAWVGYAENDDAKTIRPVAWAGFDSGYIAKAKLTWSDDVERDRGPAGTAIRSGEIVYVQDFTTDPRMAPLRESALQRGYRSGIALPLKDESARVFGVLLIYHSEPNTFTPNEIPLMEELADNLAFGIMVLRTRIERKRTEQVLKESEEKYRFLVEESFDGLFLMRGTEIVFTNSRLREMLGYGEGELEGRDHWVVYHPDYYEITRSRAQARMRGEPVVNRYEVKLQRKDGSSFDCELVAKRIHLGGEPGVQAWFRDISDRKRAEIELQKLALVVRNSSEYISLSDLDERLIFINEAGARMVGISPEKVGEHVIQDVVPDSCQDLVKTEVIPEILEKGHWDGFLQLRHIETGELTDVQAMNFLIRDPATNQPLYLASVSLDITERKKAEEALRASEQMLSTILSTSPVGIAYAKNRRIEWVNEACRQMLGLESEHEYLGHDARMFYLSEEEYDRTGQDLYLNLDFGEIGATDTKLRRKDGSVFDANVQIKALDPLDLSKGVICAISDISSRKRSEEVQRRLATAIEQSAEAIIITDANAVIQYVNPATERITGYDRSEIIGNTPRIFKSGEHDNAFYEQLWNTITGGIVWSGRLTNKKKDGTIYHEDATISPVRDASGKIINFVAVMRDVTEHLLLTRQLFQAQKMEAVGTLAGGIAHDFNNLLQVILGYSELVLADEDLAHHLKEDVERILLAGRDGADLVQRLLTFSRKTEPKPLCLNLSHLVRQINKFLQRTIPKMIDIEMILAEDLADVNADPTQMDQVLMNLAVNASDAMPEGGHLTIETANVFLDEEFTRAHLGSKPGEYVLLSMSDTGHGMGKETLQHIFEPFYTTKETGKGTGLGLAMVYGIVKQHGGYITCYSEPGQGATFNIYLPAVIPETQDDQPVITAMPQGGTETILLVDDEELIRDLGRRILERHGYTVLGASDGKEALDVYKRERGRISIVILDLIMPEMGGKQCLEEFLKIDPQVKALVASGFALNGQTKEAIETGARGFVSKPYNVKQMLQVVREVLDTE